MSRRLTRAARSPREGRARATAYRPVWIALALATSALAAGPAAAQVSEPAEDAAADRIEPDGAAGPGDASSPEGAELDPLTGLPRSMTAEPASASAAPAEGEPASDSGEWTDQGIGISLGVAIGGRVTPGGVRVTGSYLYRLSESDWFDGAAAFTIGSGAAECFRDRLDQRVCDHGPVDGFGVDFVAAVRRNFTPKKSFTPFARVGAAVRFVRFSGDQLAGLAIPLIGGGGITVDLSPTMRLVAAGQLEIGGGLFSRGLGTAPQLGLSASAGIEFALR